MKLNACFTALFLASTLLIGGACGDGRATQNGDVGNGDASAADSEEDGNNGNNRNNGNNGERDAAHNATADAGGDADMLAESDMSADVGEDADTGVGFNDGPDPVNLGAAGDFVILAKSGISTTGATAVVGDMGLSPADGTYITGFGLNAPPTTFTTSALVDGRIFAADYDPPTPAMLTTAVSAMETAYTDAAGRTLPDFTELGAGDIEGLTLVPGLYKWGTGLGFTNGITVSGGPEDVWIFQVAADLTVGNGAIVTLAGGAQAKNIFWQVAGKTTLGTTSDVKGIILSQTLIEMNTGATLLGRALAQTAVTLDATSVTQPL